MTRFASLGFALALAALASACSDEIVEPLDLNGPPSALVATGGDSQSAAVGTTLALPLSIQVLDADSVPVPAVGVAWTTTGGSLSSNADTTDANGTSSVQWSMPDVPGTYAATATVPGIGAVNFSAEAVPTVGGLLVFRFVDAGGFHACGLTTTDQIVCWGYNADGQLGGAAGPPSLYPTLVPGDPRYRVVSGGMYHGCAIDFAFEVTCWGENRDLRGLEGSVRSYQDVDAGLTHSCAITLARQVACWGYNLQGQVGEGDFEEIVDSVALVGSNYETVSAGGLHTCGIQENGNAQCWGFNGDGQLGLGSFTTPVNVPTDVATGVVFRVDPTFTPPSPDPDFPLPEGPYVSAGYAHSCAIAAAGPTYCWGLNQSGQLGDGSLTTRTAPVVVSGGFAFVRVTAGFRHTCGLTAPGDLYCWGDNTWGQLGDGTAANKSVPTPVAGGLEFAYAKAGENFTCGVTTSGVAYCWGDNHYGQLGTGTTDASLVPVRVALQP